MSTELSKSEMENQMHDAIWDNIYSEGGEVGGGNKAVEKCVEVAVDYAKQEAIGFAEFCAGYTAIRGDKRWMMHNPPFTKYTTEELYNLYLNK